MSLEWETVGQIGQYGTKFEAYEAYQPRRVLSGGDYASQPIKSLPGAMPSSGSIK